MHSLLNLLRAMVAISMPAAGVCMLVMAESHMFLPNGISIARRELSQRAETKPAEIVQAQEAALKLAAHHQRNGMGAIFVLGAMGFASFGTLCFLTIRAARKVKAQLAAEALITP